MKTAKIEIIIREDGDVELEIDNKHGLIKNGYVLKNVLDAVFIKAIEE